MGGNSKIRISFLHLALLSCILIFLAAYIFFANSIVNDRFGVEATRKRIAELKDRNEELNAQLSEVSSLNAIKNLSEDLLLEEARNISYIQVKDVSPIVLNE